VEKGLPLQLPPPTSRLTPVERQVYELIKTGATNKEISRQRGTAFSTTKNQVSTILDKLGVPRRNLLICGANPTDSLAQLHNPGMNGVTNSRR
jgi:DNA-binding NarL/FixJ family response regulator